MERMIARVHLTDQMRSCNYQRSNKRKNSVRRRHREYCETEMEMVTSGQNAYCNGKQDHINGVRRDYRGVEKMITDQRRNGTMVVQNKRYNEGEVCIQE